MPNRFNAPFSLHKFFLFKVEESCLGCRQTESGNPWKLKTCSRCKVAKYCSVDCQKEDFGRHKVSCRIIKNLTVTVDKQAEYLHHCPLGLCKEDTVDVFKYYVGKFWAIGETSEYCMARRDLAGAIFNAGIDTGSKPMLEIALGHYLELLRLIHSDDMGIRLRLPFLLMELDRDEDAYNFIKWWETIDPDGNFDWDEAPPSREGDWLYLTNQNIYEDLLNLMTPKNVKCIVYVHFMVALVLIKARILLKATEEMKDQEKHLKRYLKIIHAKNPHVLKVIAKPSLLEDMSPPRHMMSGDVSEAYDVLERCQRLFESNPIAMKFVVKMVGKNPRLQREN